LILIVFSITNCAIYRQYSKSTAYLETLITAGKRALYPTTYVHSVATILIDLLYVVLPWHYIYSNAQMDFYTKVSVPTILALGSV